MQLCAITDRRRLATATRLGTLIEEWAAGGVHFIQLREKDLDRDELQSLALEMRASIGGSKLLVNIPWPAWAGLALAAGAQGVHLSGRLAPGAADAVRRVFPDAIISVPCHSLEDVDIAAKEQADLLLFSPVFEKLSGGSPPQGLDALRRACAAAKGIPVFALGGVNSVNAPDCVSVGAAGVAGIRLFSGGEWRRPKAL